MGDPRLLGARQTEVERYSDTAELKALVIADMRETMIALPTAQGSPRRRSACRLRVVIFGYRAQSSATPTRSPCPLYRARQPGADTARPPRWRRGGRVAFRCPGLRGVRCRASPACATPASHPDGRPKSCANVADFHARVYPARMRPPRRHPLSNAHCATCACSATPTYSVPRCGSRRRVSRRRCGLVYS